MLAIGARDSRTCQMSEKLARRAGEVNAVASRRMPAVLDVGVENQVRPRALPGRLTAQDAEALIEEGIEIHPLPILPEDGN